MSLTGSILRYGRLLLLGSCGWSLLGVPLLPAQGLDIYWIDVEGGAATLIVTPERESVLIDTGWRREDGRDARRIHDVVTQMAGLERIDHLIITHFHRDHYGGTLALSRLLPIGNYYDRGLLSELAEDPQFAELYAAYNEAHQGRRRTLQAGDEIPLRHSGVPLSLRCLVSHREMPEVTGEPNPECAALQPAQPDASDNAASIGVLLKFGDFEFLDLGDLTWNMEGQLVCPVNRIGPVDVYQVTHHGLNSSNNPVLLRSVRPRVAVMNNGPRKGGHPDVFALLQSLDSLEDLFQVHASLAAGAEFNGPAEFIANLEEEDSCRGHWIRLSVTPDATGFTLTNSRNDFSRTYSLP